MKGRWDRSVQIVLRGRWCCRLAVLSCRAARTVFPRKSTSDTACKLASPSVNARIQVFARRSRLVPTETVCSLSLRGSWTSGPRPRRQLRMDILVLPMAGSKMSVSQFAPDTLVRSRATSTTTAIGCLARCNFRLSVDAHHLPRGATKRRPIVPPRPRDD